MQYTEYTKIKRQAYKSLNKLMTPLLWEENATRNVLVELLKLNQHEQYAIVLDTLDRSPCFCTWFLKGDLVTGTMPILKEFLDRLKTDTHCIHTLRLVCKVEEIIWQAYSLLATWDSLGNALDELEPHNEQLISELWEAYFIASDAFLEIANSWFVAQGNN
jgi:hypothetical protein